MTCNCMPITAVTKRRFTSQTVIVEVHNSVTRFQTFNKRLVILAGLLWMVSKSNNRKGYCFKDYTI